MDAASERRRPLTDKDRIAWLRLTRSEHVGPVTFARLMKRFGAAQAALDALPELSRRGGSRQILRVCSADRAERELEAAARLGCRLIGFDEPGYPGALRASDSAPPMLAVKGGADALALPSVAIVGSRDASAVGAKMTRDLAAGVGRAGYAVISGLAQGIDAAAHEASLGTGTVAVMAGGMDRPYPRRNVPLLERICASERGAAISEMPLGWEPRAQDFPRRNRIIAGMALGLVVVEAATRSGSLISARIAGELGRLVFAVPGSPFDPRARGANQLIRDGAILTSGPDDILEALAPLSGKARPANQLTFFEDTGDDDDFALTDSEPTDADRDRIVAALGPSPVPVDDLICRTGLPTANVQVVLLELELARRLERHPGGTVSLMPAPPKPERAR